MKSSLIIAAILLMAGFAQASVLTVCPDGCNYTSIQAAVYAAHPNDTIEVQSGTYNESVVLTKDVSFKGIDTGNGEAIVNGDLYKNGFNMTLHGSKDRKKLIPIVIGQKCPLYYFYQLSVFCSSFCFCTKSY